MSLTLDQLKLALYNADKAGDMDAARKLAAVISRNIDNPVNHIPGTPIDETVIKEPEPTLDQKIVGAGEAALSTVTGATTGQLGYLGGAAKGMAQQLLDGDFGTRHAADLVKQSAMEGASALTYSPRTPVGQEYAQNVGEAAGNLIPLTTLGPQLSAIAGGARAAIPPAVAALQDVAAPISKAAGEFGGKLVAPAKVENKQSVGAAMTPIEAQRIERARSLDVPIEFTKGQATRDHNDIAFEQKIASSKNGQDFRERFADQNQAAIQNLDSWMDDTGGTAPSRYTFGVNIGKVLQSKLDAGKNKVNAIYTEARKAGETKEKISTQPLLDFFAKNEPAEGSATALGSSRKELDRLMKLEGADNSLSVNSLEELRKFSNGVAGSDPTNIHYVTMLKKAIDGITESASGDVYRQARLARIKLARDFEDHAVVDRLLSTKPGTKDRSVAYEDVFDHIMNSPVDSIRQLRRVLQTGDYGPEGKQAWRDVQGQAVSWIKEQATKSSGRDIRGNEIVSPAGLDRAIKSLDADGKLDYLFGKNGANKMRDLNDAAKDIFTTPPRTVNYSGSGYLILDSLDTMATYFATGVPAPAMKLLMAAAKAAKNREINKQIKEHLNYSKGVK